MNILIIGYGYVGQKAAYLFRKKGYHVSATTRMLDKIPALLQKVDKAYLWTKGNFEKALENQDVVVFTAAPTSTSYYKETYLENAELLKQLIPQCPKIKKLVYTSSTSVYGDKKGADVTENTPTGPLNPQTEVLRQTEEIFLTIPNITTTLFRCGEIIGPGRTIEARLRNMINLPFPGTGDNVTNFTPVSDLVSALLFAIEKNLPGIYNLCSDLHVTRRELYEKICEARNLPDVHWQPDLATLHGGSKLILSDKLKQAGFKFEALPWEGILEGFESIP